MTTNPTFQVSLLAFPQSWDGNNIRLRILVMPQGDPLSPMLTAVAPAPDSPAFADSKPGFVAQLIPSLDALPTPGDVTTQISLATSSPSNARSLFQQLAAQFSIVPDPPGKPPRRNGYQIRKFLPLSYRQAFNFDQPSTPFALTDDTYSCMMKQLPVKTPQPPPPSTVSWGRVIGFAVRQPSLATALGLLYETTLALPGSTFFVDGGWLYLTFDQASDFGPQLAVKPNLVQSYAARIPPLTSPRPLFSAVLFPVLSSPPAASYDAAFAEAEEFSDGFVKIVHGSQPDRASLVNNSPDGLPPSGDFGLQLGWDDEQITTWYNRQIDAAQIDAPFGVAGYRVDVRAHGDTAWNSLCRVTGTLALGPTSLGNFQGEFGVETLPVRLDPTQPGDWWLPIYFTHWRGGSLVVPDSVAMQLLGKPPSTTPYHAVNADEVPLLYGRSYDLRVRMMDLSRGGPSSTDMPVNPGPAPIATIPFRRLVPFKAVTIPNLNLSATSSAPQTSYQIHRPLLNYPSVVYAGVPNAVTALLADLPGASAAGREAGLPDPDAVAVSLEVQIRQLAGDASIFVQGNDNAPYSLLYATTRDFPADPTQPLQLDVSFQDIPDLTVLPVQPASGPLVLPRARDVRIVIRAAAKDDPQLLYWGSVDAMVGQPLEVLTAADPFDERALFVPDSEVDRIRGILLQPDPVQTSNLAATQAVSGQAGTAAADVAGRLAQAMGLNVSGLTYSGRAGRRVVFGCSSALRHSISPEHGALTFAANTELCHHWLIGITLDLARDWSWTVPVPVSFELRNTANQVIGSVDLKDAISTSALTSADRSTTSLIFFDAVDYKPQHGALPSELELTYTVTPVFAAAPTKFDPPLQLHLHLPIAAQPVQTPQLVSAGIALSPYSPAPDYSTTMARKRALWFEFAQPVADPDDIYFCRVLAYGPDQVLTGAPFTPPKGIDLPPEAPLEIDPELIRVIVPGQSDDHSGLGAMQPLIPSSSPIHFMLPLPPGIAVDAPELFGMFVYELRAGHAKKWSTAQGRFGPPLRVAGVQHPAPALSPVVSSLPNTINVSAPYATPVFSGRNLLPNPPLSQLWALLYAQVTQADGAQQRNILLDRVRLGRRDNMGQALAIAHGLGEATWARNNVESILASLALPSDSSLSLVVVETLPNIGDLSDPLGGDLGNVRILRTSPLVAIPSLC